MGNFTFSEIFTIIVVILIVFGPNRLPEIARKAGALAARARSAIDSLKTELNSEYGDALGPLREARDELRAAGSEIKGQIAQFGNEMNQAGTELRGAAEEAIKPSAARADSDTPGETPDLAGSQPAASNGSAHPPGLAPPGEAAVSDAGDSQLARHEDEIEPPPVPQDGLELDGG